MSTPRPGSPDPDPPVPVPYLLFERTSRGWGIRGWETGQGSRRARPLAAALVALLVLSAAWGWPRAGLGQDEAPGDLLAREPFDRITLADGTTLAVEPIRPRPLPPIDARKEARRREEERRRRGKEGPPPGGNISLPGEPSKFVPLEPEPDEEAEMVTIHLLDGDPRDFKVKRANINEIEYCEDMLLKEADRRIRAGDFTRAFEHVLAVRRRAPDWPGIDERADRLLFAEGSAALRDGDDPRGLRLLGELRARRPDYPGLADRLAAAYAARINAAFEAADFARGRTLLHDAEAVAPAHEALRAARERFVARARERAEAAGRLAGAERLDALAEALRIWPALEGAAPRFEAAFRDSPTLDVAVIDTPERVTAWTRCPADERTARLVYLPILAAADEAAAAGERPGQLARALEKAELGERLDLRLRPGIAWSDGSRPASAADVVRALADRADPRSPAYNARWAALLKRAEAADAESVRLTLTRAPLRPESLLTLPVGPAHAAADGWIAAPDGRRPVGDGPFRPAEPGDSADSATFLAVESGNAVPKLRRLRETRPEDAVAALLRGEVSLIEHVPPDRVAALGRSEGIRVGRYSSPSLHRIALDGRNPALRNRSLRRGLSYAIDRKVLLEETVLRRPPDDEDRPSSGAFARGSFAAAPDVPPLGYDPLLARMLVAAARKELGGNPIALTFEYPDRPEARAIAPKLAESWRAAGVAVEARARPASALEAELRAGRRFDLAYRATRSEGPTWDAGPLLCPGYDAPPDADALASLTSPRILQLLLELERAPEWPTATALLLRIDRETPDELPVLPLWQIVEHYAWRARLTGPAEVADHLYDGIETWEIEPWFARDPW